GVSQIGPIVEGHDDAAAQRRTDGAHALEGERHVKLVRSDEAPGGAAQQDRAQVAAAARSTGQIQELAQRCAERHLVHARPRDAPGEAEQLRPSGTLGADPSVSRPALEDDVEDIRERLDVIDDGWLAEEANLRRERPLVAW